MDNISNPLMAAKQIRDAKKAKRDALKVIVRLRATGELMVLDSMRELVPRLHEIFKGDEEVVETPETPKAPQVPVEKTEAGKARFDELHAARGWQKKELKEEYSQLKAIYG